MAHQPAILGAVNVVATYFGFRYIDRLGRRPLALVGFAGMAVFMVVAAIDVFLIKTRTKRESQT